MAETSQKAIEARAILKKFGIDINDATNGVFLPIAENISSAAYHPRLHTDIYYNEVNRLLSKVASVDKAKIILEDIAQQLIKGTFPH